MSDSGRPGRRVRLTLVVRDETDDASILDGVRRAIEDGLLAPVGRIGVAPATREPAPERRSPLDERLETAAREAVEEALANTIEAFQRAGAEPAFDPAKWSEQLAKVWAGLRKATAAGVDIRPVSVNASAEGS